MTNKIYLSFLRQALDEVEDVYYGLHHWCDSMLNANGIYEDDPRREELIPYFERRDERVFCYEFYHRVRTLMDGWTHAEGSVGRLRLQGELRKVVIGQLAAEILGATPLPQVYCPDLILHAPGDFRSQELVIEVKTAPNLTWSKISHDLEKLNEFVGKYGFAKALFLVTNNSPEHIARILGTEQARQWIVDHLPYRTQLLVWCKEKPHATLWERNVGSLAGR